eukprot:scaffold32676_cov61-Phaeocystis_antarctica.AAC.1
MGHLVEHAGYTAPQVEAREEITQRLEARHAGAGRESGAEEDHKEEGERYDDLHDLRRQLRVKPEADEWQRQASRVEEHADPHAGVVGGVGVEAGDQAAEAYRVDDDQQYQCHHRLEVHHGLHARVHQRVGLLGDSVAPVGELDQERLEREEGDDLQPHEHERLLPRL